MSKKIVFEGQEVGVSSTMQKLQRQAEQMSNTILTGYAKASRSSKELIELMNQEIDSKNKIGQLASRDKRFEIAEKYSRKLDEINQKEREYMQRLREQPLNAAQMRKYEISAEKDFAEERQFIKGQEKSDILAINKQIEEQRTTNDLLKTLIEQDRLQWEQEVKTDRRGVEREISRARSDGFDKLPPEQQAKIMYQEALLKETAGTAQKTRSVMADILGAGLIRDLGGIIAQMPSARDAFDLLPAISQISGGIGGGLMGTIAEAATAGQIEFGVMGAEVGRQIGAMAGSAAMRSIEEQERLEQSTLRVRAITGNMYGEGGMTRFGLSQAESAAIAGELYRQAGVTPGEQGFDRVSLSQILGLEFGYGIDRGTLMQGAAGTRLTGGNFGRQMESLLGTANIEGIDRVFFQELISNQNQLISIFGQTMERVDPRNATAIMMEFNRLGGMFRADDPRSMGMIQSINQGLSSPGNDFQRAFNFDVLRQMNPEASLLDLMQMQEQGLGGERGREFLGLTIGAYRSMFGDDEDLIVLSLKQRFPNIPIEQLRRLAKGEDVFGQMDVWSVGQTQFDITGEQNVSRRSIMQAEVTDAFAIGAVEGMNKVKEQLTGIVSSIMEDALNEMKDSFMGTVRGQTPNVMPGFSFESYMNMINNMSLAILKIRANL